MPLSNQRGRLRALPIERHEIDFGRGVGLRDGLISDGSHLLQATNVNLSQGRIRARFGSSTLGTPPADAASYFYFAPTQGTFGTYYAICETAGRVYSSPSSPSGPWALAAGTPPTMSASGYEQGMASDMVEFNGLLLLITTSGLYSYNNTTWALVTSSVVGTSIAVWQNKIWVAGVGSRVYFSKAGDHTTWDALDYVDIREGGNNTPVLGLHATHDMDIQGRPSLIAYKGQYGPGSVYRINDPTTGAFTTLSATVGPIHKRAIASNGEVCVFIAADGIYMTSGASVPQRISDEIGRLFQSDHNTGTPTGTHPAPMFFDGRFLFAFPGKGLASGFLTGTGAAVQVEWDPSAGAFVVHQWPQFNPGISAGAIQAWVANNSTLIASGAAGALLYSRLLNKAAADDAGTANKAVIQTPYLELADGKRFRIHRMRMDALLPNISVGAPFTLRVRKDGSTSDTLTRTLTTASSVLTPYDFKRLGDCRSVSFIFELPIAAGQAQPSGYAPYDTGLTTLVNEIERAVVEYTPTGRN